MYDAKKEWSGGYNLMMVYVGKINMRIIDRGLLKRMWGEATGKSGT